LNEPSPTIIYDVKRDPLTYSVALTILGKKSLIKNFCPGEQLELGHFSTYVESADPSKYSSVAPSRPNGGEMYILGPAHHGKAVLNTYVVFIAFNDAPFQKIIAPTNTDLKAEVGTNYRTAPITKSIRET
jgi:hypothetical protein